MTRTEQLKAARTKLPRWAKRHGIPLHCVEFVVPFVETDFSLSAWLFFENDEQLHRAEEEGWSDRLASQLCETLRKLGYPSDRLAEIRFRFDSHETVIRDYEGSYFYRLR